MEGLDSCAEAIEETFFTDWCRISDPVATSGAVNRSTLKFEVEEPHIAYEGHCQIIQAESLRFTKGEAPTVTDENLLQIPRGNNGVVKVGMEVYVMNDADSLPSARFRVVRVPPNTSEMTTDVYVRRTTFEPTPA